MRALVAVLRDIQKDLHLIASLMLFKRLATEEKFGWKGQFDEFIKKDSQNRKS